ncbi:MAG: GNAT family N-acetyltransferase [Myxococcota bacterium]
MPTPPCEELDRTLRTNRLELRPLHISHVDALWPYVSDPELPKLMTWEAHRDRSETVQFVEGVVAARQAGTGYVWAFHRQEVLCGLVGLHEVVRTVRAWRQDRAELGYWCGAEHRGRGYITEAAREAIRFGFQDLGLHKITVCCATENHPSRRVIEKLGFRFVGEQRDHFHRFGRWWNHLLFELVVEDWRP